MECTLAMNSALVAVNNGIGRANLMMFSKKRLIRNRCVSWMCSSAANSCIYVLFLWKLSSGPLCRRKWNIIEIFRHKRVRKCISISWAHNGAAHGSGARCRHHGLRNVAKSTEHRFKPNLCKHSSQIRLKLLTREVLYIFKPQNILLRNEVPLTSSLNLHIRTMPNSNELAV